MKFRGHETFFLRKGWLNKGLKELEKNYRIFTNKDIYQPDFLGIGTNMVKAQRYWLVTFNLIEEVFIDGIKGYKRTDFGDLLWKYDKYFQEEGTNWLLHYQVVTNFDNATSWSWFFNDFDFKKFEKNDFIESLSRYIRVKSDIAVAERSLSDDFNCLINTYYSKYDKKKSNPESNIVSPLRELKILSLTDDDNYVKNDKSCSDIPLEVLFFVMIDQVHNKNIDIRNNEISISEVVKGRNNIGKVFNMDYRAVNQALDQMQSLGLLKVTRTAGLDIVNIFNEDIPLAFLEKYYNSMEN